MKKIRFFLSPYFLIQSYLLKDISIISKKYHFKDNVLDIGCGSKPYRQFFNNIKYVGIDFNTYFRNKYLDKGSPDYFFDSNYLKTNKLKFHSKSFKNIFCFQVLEHHSKPELLIKEISRIIKPGGYFVLSVPFMWGVHDEPNDYCRFTKYAIYRLLKDANFKIIEFRAQGSVFSTVSSLLNQYLVNFLNKDRKRYLVALLLYPLLLFFSYLSFILDKIFVSKEIFMSSIIVSEKK